MSDGRVTLGDMARLRVLFGALRAVEIMRPAGDGRTDERRRRRSARPPTAGLTPSAPARPASL